MTSYTKDEAPEDYDDEEDKVTSHDESLEKAKREAKAIALVLVVIMFVVFCVFVVRPAVLELSAWWR